ncbi:unnamed protein product [Leptidea sinapis]|uniref:Uncharacterized protein n=1 Tax=Leptidea sinapis TaxID=189913 RepID=A0A5E4QF46_9NEOP|nr:unnamed protein product [Leptidea sinapis]
MTRGGVYVRRADCGLLARAVASGAHSGADRLNRDRLTTRNSRLKYLDFLNITLNSPSTRPPNVVGVGDAERAKLCTGEASGEGNGLHRPSKAFLEKCLQSLKL